MAPYQEVSNIAAKDISSPNVPSGESSSTAAVPSLQLTQSEDVDDENITASAQPNYNNEDREVIVGQRCSSTEKDLAPTELVATRVGSVNNRIPTDQLSNRTVQSENVVEADENDMHDTINKRRSSSSDSLKHIQFKDPFPSLSMQSSNSSTNMSANVAQHKRLHENKNNSTTHSQPSPLRTIPQFDTNQPTNKLQSNIRSISEGLCTPPPFSYYDTSPLQSPQPPDRSPIQTVCNNLKKIWLDPFPTPDVSVCSSRKSYNNTPCSSRIRNDNDDDNNIIDGKYADNNIIMGASDSWNKILSVPIIPPIEELDISPEKDSNQSIQKSSEKSKSSPRLHQSNTAAAADNLLPIRKVASDGALFPMMKRPSMEDIWGALQSGPDGNELDTDFNKNNGDDDNVEGKKRLSWNESFEHNNRGQQKDLHQHNSTVTPKASLHKSYTTPLNTSWDDQVGLRRRAVGNENQSINNDDEDRQIVDNNRVKQQQQVANSHTITNVTGANLAKEVKLLMKQRESPNNGTMTPGRLQRVVRKASTFVITPVKTRVKQSSQHAVKLVRSTQQKLKERKERRRQRRLARMKEPPRSWWIVIPSDHPYKIAWDVLTMLWAILGAYRTHVRIRDREFDQSPLIILTEIWFTLDILLNFVTEHKTRKGEVIRDGKSIWARYLTTWFIIDILSLVPWERIYVQPVVQRIKRRNIFQKTFFRSKACVRVSRVLRGRHIKLFGRVSKQTGTPLRRMVSLVIKYLPKYLVFLRNMKGALVVRALRFAHWIHNMYKKIWVKAISFRDRGLRGEIFSPLRRRNTNSTNNVYDHSDSSDSDDDDLDDDESVHSDDSGGDDNSLSESEVDTPEFSRSHSEGSPVVALRRRCFSQNEIGLQN